MTLLEFLKQYTLEDLNGIGLIKAIEEYKKQYGGNNDSENQ